MDGLSHSEVLDIFTYREDEGHLVWRRYRGARAKEGCRAGCLKIDGCGIHYWQVSVSGKTYFAHRLIWFYVHGEWPVLIDHKNGNTLDNRMLNLRSVSNDENQKNKSIGKNNLSGVTGVVTKCGKWGANICVNRKNLWLGSYDDFFEACCARKSAENKHGFHENHGRAKRPAQIVS